YIAENLSARATEFAARINDQVGGRSGDKEVDASINALFTWAAWADKYDGRAKGVPIRGVALAMNEPVGTIGVLCPDAHPLLGLVASTAPAIAMGNTVTAVASHAYPLSALDFSQILETSDLPGGVLNILTGNPVELSKTLADHLNVDAVWSFTAEDVAKHIEAASSGNLKRTWVETTTRDWTKPDAQAFLTQATEVKTIWIPYGE
ncbi:MAG: aldehyde dehydrogenase family protein, partial [Pseudomonadota bacterium]